MAKEFAILAISIVTLMMAGFVAYSVYDSNGINQASATIDYTEEFESIQSTLDEVNEKLAALESDTVEEFLAIKSELQELKEKNETELIPQASIPFKIITDKNTYQVGDTIKIAGQGVVAQEAVKIDLLSTFNELITSKTTSSNSNELAYGFKLPSFVQAGNYYLKATHGADEKMVIITVVDVSESDTTANVSTSTSSSLSFSLDKEEYAPGDIIRVSGFGQVDAPVSLVLKGPDDVTLTANASTDENGAFSPIFILDADAETGSWEITATQGDREAKLSFKIKN